MRLPLLLLLLLPLAAPAQAPAPAQMPDALPRLLAEREALTRAYAEASAQRHSLFGNKPSKKDLQEVVNALQGIVDQDQRIVDVLARTTAAAQTTARHYSSTATQLENTSRGDRNLTAQRLHEARNELLNNQERESQLRQQLADAKADAADAQRGRTIRDVLIAGLGLICVGLFFWRRR